MKVMRYGLLAVAAALVLTGCTVDGSARFSVDNCSYREDRSATVPVEKAKDLVVHAGAGSLRIEGSSDLTEVRVRGTACAASENLVRDIQLKTGQKGDAVEVEAVLPQTAFGNSPYLDMVIEVPRTLMVRVTDQSGNVQVEGVAGVTIVDGSGSMDLVEVTGDIRIRDESGDIEVRRSTGNVVIERDGSGSIRVAGLKGNLTVEVDDSGDISVEDVQGSVDIESDGSGSIDVRTVTGDFTVGRDGSGDIRYSGVDGSVRVPSKR